MMSAATVSRGPIVFFSALIFPMCVMCECGIVLPSIKIISLSGCLYKITIHKQTSSKFCFICCYVEADLVTMWNKLFLRLYACVVLSFSLSLCVSFWSHFVLLVQCEL